MFSIKRRTYVGLVSLASLALSGCSGSNSAPAASSAAAGPVSNEVVSRAADASNPTPLFNEVFNPPNGSSSQVGTAGLTTPDGLFRIDGPWSGTGGNDLLPSLAKFTTADPTDAHDSASGFMTLTASAGDPLQGSEMTSNALPGYGYGYYEARMIVDPTHANGGVVSFFWIAAGGSESNRSYGPQEFDIEFLLNESWVNSSNSGAVHYTTHPSNATHVQNFSFNPSLAYHRFGFLWQPGSLAYTIDGQIVYTVTNSDVAKAPADGGWLMANVWTGEASWGGGPASIPLTGVYNWFKFYPGATSVPAN